MSVEIDKNKYCPGRILYLYQVDFGTTIKNKYSIILHVDEEVAIIMHCFPTSRMRGNQGGELGHGCHSTMPNRRDSCYLWTAGKVIGIDGFSFDVTTVVNFRMNLDEWEYPDFEIMDINEEMELLDTLTPEELTNFINCALASPMTSRGYKRKLRRILEG